MKPEPKSCGNCGTATDGKCKYLPTTLTKEIIILSDEFYDNVATICRHYTPAETPGKVWAKGEDGLCYLGSVCVLGSCQCEKCEPQIAAAFDAGMAVVDKRWQSEVDEFNRGCKDYDNGVPHEDEPGDTKHDMWRVGWAWSAFKEPAITKTPAPSGAEEDMGSPCGHTSRAGFVCILHEGHEWEHAYGIDVGWEQPTMDSLQYKQYSHFLNSLGICPSVDHRPSWRDAFRMFCEGRSRGAAGMLAHIKDTMLSDLEDCCDRHLLRKRFDECKTWGELGDGIRKLKQKGASDDG